jgi:hypothetical protein
MNKLLRKVLGSNSEVSTKYFPSHSVDIDDGAISIVEIEDNRLRISVDLGQTLSDGIEIIPCFVSSADFEYGYQAYISHSENNGKMEVFVSPIGEYGEINIGSEESSDSISSEIDLFVLKDDINDPSLIFNIVGFSLESFSKTQSLITISIYDKVSEIRDIRPNKTIQLDVPQMSQMTFAPEIRRRICSPTSISMVQEYLGNKSNILALADRAYNKTHDMYGVWPQNIWAMSGKGLIGYVCRLSDYGDVISLLENRVPLIVSINYKEGELTSAAIKETSGHLVVITGLSEKCVLVNDPAAEAVDNVAREYDINEFKKVWLGKKGVAYIIFSTKTEVV